jgi:peptidyl-prolyl cis-trans isomerase NIMA-interacting 1
MVSPDKMVLSTFSDCTFDQWEVRLSTSRNLPYFFNSETQESSWEAPPDLTAKQISQLPGAKYLESNDNPGQVRASHILVKHKDSRKPSSWKEVRITPLLDFGIQQIIGFADSPI